MDTTGSAALAERIAREAHATQMDKAGQPYVAHLERVVAHLRDRHPDASEEEVAAAWLHDVLEDTDWTPGRLRDAGIPGQVVAMVQELTRPHGTAYLPWVGTLAAGGSLSAVRVKLADNADNSDPARVAALPDGLVRLEVRYQPARALLEKRLA